MAETHGHAQISAAGPACGEGTVRRNGRNRFARASLRLCAGLSLLVILLVWFDAGAIVRKLLAIDTGFLLLALLLFTLQFAVCCARWVVILDRQGSAITPRTALSIFGTGTLANLFLVTSLAGMSVRAALLVRAGTGLAGALAPVAAERLAALCGLALCGIAGFVFALGDLRSFAGEWVSPKAAAFLLAAIGTAGLIVLAAARKSGWFGGFVGMVAAAFQSPGQAVQLIGASAAIVLLGFAGMAALAQGMGLSIDLMFFLSVMPAVAFISSLPISIGGWGVREGAMVAGLSIYAVPPSAAMALSISYGLAGLLVALLLGAGLAMLGQSRDQNRRGG